MAHANTVRWLGRFDTPEAAAVAYDEEARRLFGAAALVNFPVGFAPPLAPVPKSPGREMRVIEVNINTGRAALLAKLPYRTDNKKSVERSAQELANNVHVEGSEGDFRLIYVSGQFTTAVAWRPIGNNEHWVKSQRLAEAAFGAME
jgi:hypothetical protein